MPSFETEAFEFAQNLHEQLNQLDELLVARDRCALGIFTAIWNNFVALDAICEEEMVRDEYSPNEFSLRYGGYPLFTQAHNKIISEPEMAVEIIHGILRRRAKSALRLFSAVGLDNTIAVLIANDALGLYWSNFSEMEYRSEAVGTRAAIVVQYLIEAYICEAALSGDAAEAAEWAISTLTPISYTWYRSLFIRSDRLLRHFRKFAVRQATIAASAEEKVCETE